MSVLTPYINAIDTITDDTISDVIESKIVNCDKNILIYKEYDNVNLYNNDIYQESGNGVLTKIKNGLKYIWEKIVLIFRSIVNKISSLFNKNKINEGDSINDIADNVISKNKNHTKTLVGLSGAALITGLSALGYKVIKSKKNKNFVSVTIPADPSSKSISQTTVEIPVNEGITVKKSNDDTIIMSFNTLSSSSMPVENKRHGARKLPSNAYHVAIKSAVHFVHFIKDTEYRKELNYIISEIIKCINGEHVDIRTVDDRLDKLFSEDSDKRIRKICGGPKSADDLDHPEKFEIKITENEAINAQKFLNETIDRLTSIQSFDKISDVPDDVMDMLNKVMNDLSDIQYSANRVMGYINDDARFIYADKIESIKDPAVLGEYIMECIKNGFPAKYIAYNAWLLSHRSIRGNGISFKPIWGQTRAIFIPPNKDIIYKIALSSAGMFGNKTEAEFSKQIKKYGGKDLVAEVVNHYNDGINAMERVTTKNINNDENSIDDLKNNIKTFLSTNIPKAEIFDIHDENVGINKNGKLVVVDYGNAYLNKG